MTCKQEFLVPENGESLLPCRVAASFPSWCALSFILGSRSLCRRNPSPNKRSLYLLAAYLSSAPLIFAGSQLDTARNGYTGNSQIISNSRPPFSACGGRALQNARAKGGTKLSSVFPECSRLTSEFPISRFRFSIPVRGRGRGYIYIYGVFAHLIRRRFAFASCR